MHVIQCFAELVRVQFDACFAWVLSATANKLVDVHVQQFHHKSQFALFFFTEQQSKPKKNITVINASIQMRIKE